MPGGPKVRSVDVELDHIFVLCSVDAPEARVLTQLGFKEGLLAFERCDQYEIELTLDRGILGQTSDLRPGLPIRLRW